MDGLIIAGRLAKLSLPLALHAWHFPTKHEYVMRFADGTNLLIDVQPTEPAVAVVNNAPPAAAVATPFQHQLRSRVSGDLIAVEQFGLDRVFSLTFQGGGDGFVRSAPATLIVELAGRNANVVLVNEAGTILGVHRTVTAKMNRYRQLRPGIAYTPPPPYERLDPRTVTEEQFTELVAEHGAAGAVREFDGLGPALQRIVLHTAGANVYDAFQAVVADPEGALARYPEFQRAAAPRQHIEQQRKLVRQHVQREYRQRLRRVQDAEKNLTAGERAQHYRALGDVLMAYQGDTRGQHEIALTDFQGNPITIAVDPGLRTHENAEVYYQRARKNLQRVAHAERELPALTRALEIAEAKRAELPELSDEEIRRKARTLQRQKRSEEAARQQPGLRTTSPSGIPIVIGRSSKENDAVTFRVAKSRDMWFHAQGYRGAHVILQTRGAEAPFADVLYAAALAAGYSEASESGNVAVDYTERKHVWRQKGGGPGAVHFTQYRTVWVDPRTVSNE